MRRAPAGGYDFGNKRQYRRDVWGAFVRDCPGPIAAAHYLIMPSLEGAEIEEAMKRGVRPQHLHCVDDNPAIVATLKKRYPLIQTYGVTIERAAARVAAAGVELAGANVDLTGPVDDRHWATVAGVVNAARWVDQAHVAVTALRGREGSGWHEIYAELGAHFCADSGESRQDIYDHVFRRVHGGSPNAADLGRLVFMQQAMSSGEWVARPRWAIIYKSGIQTMLVGFFLLRPRAAVAQFMAATAQGYQRWCSWWDRWIELEASGEPRGKGAPSDPAFRLALRAMLKGL